MNNSKSKTVVISGITSLHGFSIGKTVWWCDIARKCVKEVTVERIVQIQQPTAKEKAYRIDVSGAEASTYVYCKEKEMPSMLFLSKRKAQNAMKKLIPAFFPTGA